MTDTQLYLSIGLPTLAVVLGMILNGFLFNALSARMSSVESGLSARMSGVESGLSARMTSIENRMLSLEEHMDLIIGKIGEMDTRLSVLEDRMNRP